MKTNDNPLFTNNALKRINNSPVLPSIKSLLNNKAESALAKDIMKLDLSLSNILSSKQIYSPKKRNNNIKINSRKYKVEHGHIFTMGIDHQGISQLKDLLQGFFIGSGFAFLKMAQGDNQTKKKVEKLVKFEDYKDSHSQELYERHMNEIQQRNSLNNKAFQPFTMKKIIKKNIQPILNRSISSLVKTRQFQSPTKMKKNSSQQHKNRYMPSVSSKVKDIRNKYSDLLSLEFSINKSLTNSPKHQIEKMMERFHKDNQKSYIQRYSKNVNVSFGNSPTKKQFLNPNNVLMVDLRKQKNKNLKRRMYTQGRQKERQVSCQGISLQKSVKDVLKNTNIYKNATKNVNQILGEINTENYNSDQLSSILLQYVGNDSQKRIIATWMPPSSCPRLTGMITYSYYHKTCEIKEYLWVREVMSGRYFQAIVRHMSMRQKSPVYSIFLICTTLEYQKYFRQCGWTIARKEPLNKLKIEFLPTKTDI